MALTFDMSGQTGNKSKQFNKSQGQYMGNLGGFANRASAQGEEQYGGIQQDLGKYDQAVGDIAAFGGENLVNFVQHPGYTPQEQQGMRLATTMPMESAFNTAGYQNRQSAALTGNAGATTAANAQLAREKARTMAGGLAGLQGQFANARREDTQAGVNAVPQFMGTMANAFQFPSTLRAGLYNTNMSAQMQALQGQQAGVDAYKQRSMQPGFLKQAALAGIQGLAGAGSTMMMGGLKPPTQPVH